MAKNTTCVTIDKEAGLTAQDFKAVLRTCSPDDMPVVGSLKRYPNLYVNSGHGGRNCSLSIACSKLVAEMMQGEEPSTSMQDTKSLLTPLRYQM